MHAKKTPLQPGFSLLHWMDLCRRANDLAGRKGKPLRLDISTAEVEEHNSKYDAWTILNGEVYNITPYIPYHPGGEAELLRAAGHDCTALFNEVHSWVNAHEMLKACHLGKHSESASSINNNSRNSNSCLQLIEKKKISSNAFLFQFSVQKGANSEYSEIGQHIIIRALINNQVIERPYTPISLPDQSDRLDFYVKLYPHGKMSNFLNNLKLGEKVEFLSSRGSFTYLGRGKVILRKKEHTYKKIALVAAGSGITPMIQVIRSVFADQKDTTELVLIYCNRSIHDIIAYDQLNVFQNENNRFKVQYILNENLNDDSNLPSSVTFGRLNDDMLLRYLPTISQESEPCLILHCGPKSFDQYVGTSLLRIGYSPDHIYCF